MNRVIKCARGKIEEICFDLDNSINRSSVFVLPGPLPIPRTVESIQVAPADNAVIEFESARFKLLCAWIPRSKSV